MTTCEALSERMPAVASGGAGWTDEEAAHVASCGDCRAEWSLVQAARGLGRSVGPEFAAEGMASRVLARVRASQRADARRRATRRALTWGGLAAAAALMLVVLFGAPAQRADIAATAPDTTPPAAVAFQLPLPELDDAAPAELQAVLDGLDAPLGESSTLENPGDDVTGQDLERVLRAWEG